MAHRISQRVSEMPLTTEGVVRPHTDTLDAGSRRQQLLVHQSSQERIRPRLWDSGSLSPWPGSVGRYLYDADDEREDFPGSDLFCGGTEADRLM